MTTGKNKDWVKTQKQAKKYKEMHKNQQCNVMSFVIVPCCDQISVHTGI